MMKTAVRILTPENVQAELLVIPAFEEKNLFDRTSADIARLAGRIPPQISAGLFLAKKGQSITVPSALHPHQLVILAGMGRRSDLSLEQIRRLGAVATSNARAVKAKRIACLEPDPTGFETSDVSRGLTAEDVAQSMIEGALLAAYRFGKYLTQDLEQNFAPAEFTLVGASSKRQPALVRGTTLARTVCRSVYLARDLTNAPGSEITPDALARHARLVGRERGVSVTVLNERRIAALGMGGLSGVAQGSIHPPRFIIMEYRPARPRRRTPTIVLVGKGITFDSGGISIKPSANMAEMKMDMSGAAAVIGTVQAVARLGFPVHLVGLIPAAENMPGGKAIKPGDIVKHLNGMTSEIDNTDAEGRLILADALAYATRYSPDLVIDLATLTGAVVVALGHVATGMLGTDEGAMRQLEQAGQRTYERVWQLPLFEEYERLIKSEIADMKNTGGRWAGAITGAMFLKKFTGTYRWVHLDIAGTAIMEDSTEYIPKGGSGVGVRLLVDMVRHWNNL
jgi:leucyl aminopeptidase